LPYFPLSPPAKETRDELFADFRMYLGVHCNGYCDAAYAPSVPPGNPFANRSTTMTLSLSLACLWCILANVIAMFPSKKKHWPAAYVLMAFGVPLLGLVVWENGIWIGLLVLAAAVSILRWPALYLWRWLRSVTGALIAR